MDTREAYEQAARLHENLQKEALNMGVSEEYISTLVDTFYGKVRADADLGPIFDQVIGDNWGPHLAKMKRFWGALALRTGDYEGEPMRAHLNLEGVAPEHFETWLALFRETLKETAPSEGCAAYFQQFADKIAARFRSAMFGYRRDASLPNA